MGMKWGIHRYRDTNGKLTPKGRLKFDEVSDNPRKVNKHNKRAISVYKSNKKQSDLGAYINERRGNINAVKYFTTQSELYKQKISDIKSGKIKAGRDFIVQTDYNIGGLPPFYITLEKEQRIINKPK